MRTGMVLAALTATLLMPIRPASAAIGCLVGHPWNWSPGATHATGNTQAGMPCQLGFGERGGVIQRLRIAVRPAHGILGTAAPEGGHHYLAYVPKAGFAGHDRFELSIQVIPPRGSMSMTTRFIVDMDVTP